MYPSDVFANAPPADLAVVGRLGGSVPEKQYASAGAEVRLRLAHPPAASPRHPLVLAHDVPVSRPSFDAAALLQSEETFVSRR